LEFFERARLLIASPIWYFSYLSAVGSTDDSGEFRAGTGSRGGDAPDQNGSLIAKKIDSRRISHECFSKKCQSTMELFSERCKFKNEGSFIFYSLLIIIIITIITGFKSTNPAIMTFILLIKLPKFFSSSAFATNNPNFDFYPLDIIFIQ
jgi:hypothetical protein